MGEDSIRHLLRKRLADGRTAYYWNPSATLRSLGMTPEALGMDDRTAKARAIALNGLADGMRLGNRPGSNGPQPGTFSALVTAFRRSDEYLSLKDRTRKDYDYYLGKVELEFGDLPAAAITARVAKDYYKRVRRERTVTWAYHIMWALRAVLSWAVSEDWIPLNPALAVTVSAPPKRRVIWTPEQAAAYIEQARADGWLSIVAMAYVFDSTAQSPVDVIHLKRGAYDGLAIDVSRAKTGETDAPIPLFPAAKAALDAYLETVPAGLPAAPLFVHDRSGGPWHPATLRRVHRQIRAAAGLPAKMQLQDFRRTAQTEAGAAGATVDEIRALARHSTRAVAERYVMPDDRFVNSAQSKRLAYRTRAGEKEADEAGTSSAESDKSQNGDPPKSE